MVRKRCWRCRSTRSPLCPPRGLPRRAQDTDKILNILKASQEQNKKTLEQIDSTLAASSPDVKKSCCRWMDANVKEMEPSFWRFFQDQSVDQPVANRQSVTGRAEPQYILCNVPTGVFMS